MHGVLGSAIPWGRGGESTKPCSALQLFRNPPHFCFCRQMNWWVAQASSHSSQGVVDGRVNETAVSTAVPDRSAIILCWMDHGKVTVRTVVAPAPQPEPVSRLKSAMHDVNFLRSDSRCRWWVTTLSNISLRYHVSEQKGRVSLLWLIFSSRLSSLLLRWRLATLLL